MASSSGVDRFTGKVLTDWAHVLQSLLDIYSTPRKTRVMRRDYGSEVPELIDRPMVRSTLADYVVALGEGADLWEPRFTLERMWVDRASPSGVLEPAFDGVYYPLGHIGDVTVKSTIQGIRRSNDEDFE